MSDAPTTVPATPPKKSGLFSYLAWWKTDPAEIETQIAQYNSLKVWQSARGLSLLCCLFTVSTTVLLGGFINLSGGAIITEAVIWAALGLLMFRGQTWAFVTSMVLWTLEKGYLLLGGAAGTGAPIVQVIWWAIYLHQFMLGFRVERGRKSAVPAAVVP